MNETSPSTPDLICSRLLRHDLLVRAHEARSLLDTLLSWQMHDRLGLKDELRAGRSALGSMPDEDMERWIRLSQNMLDEKGSIPVLSFHAFCLLFGQHGVEETNWRLARASNRIGEAHLDVHEDGCDEVSGLSMFETRVLVKGYRKAATDLLTNLLHARDTMSPVFCPLDMLPRIPAAASLEHLTSMLGHAARLRLVLSDLPGEPPGLTPPYWSKVVPVMFQPGHAL